MKKILGILSIFVIALSLVGCVRTDDDYETETISTVYDLRNSSFTYNATDGYLISKTFNSPLFEGDNVLIYRMSGTTDNGAPIWQLLPRTIFLSNSRELDYDYDFSRYDIQIYAGGNYDVSTTPEYLNNQTFRVVIIPGSTPMAKSVNKPNFDNYEEVISYYKLDDSNPKTL